MSSIHIAITVTSIIDSDAYTVVATETTTNLGD